MPDEAIWEEESELTEREGVRSDRARGSVDGSGARKRPPRKPDTSRSVSSDEQEVSAFSESASGDPSVPSGEPEADTLCPRWMYHRKGVWCKTCFQTPKRDGVLKGLSLEGHKLGAGGEMTVKTNFKPQRQPKKRGNR